MTNDTSARSAREILAAHDQMDRAEAALDAIPAPLPAEYVTATLGSDAWYGVSLVELTDADGQPVEVGSIAESYSDDENTDAETP